MKAYCKFEKLDAEWCRCVHCGRLMRDRNGCENNVRVCVSPDAPRINVKPANSGELLEQAKTGAERLGVTWEDGKHYAIALARWSAAGWPRRSQEEVERIYYECCAPEGNPCENNINGRCKLCGCRVNLGIALRNKIRMATEDCPAGFWHPDLERLRGIFQKVFLVNLDKRPDRYDKFSAGVPADWPFAAIERVAAVDGTKITVPGWWRTGAGAWGCYRTHLKIIEECLNTGVESVLLLEDDAIFCDGFTKKATDFMIHLPSDWGMVYLGGQHLKTQVHPPRRVNHWVYRPYNVNRTHAFALRGETMRAAYQHLTSHDWRTAHHIDHHLGQFHQQGKYPIYCPREWLVGQSEGRSNIAGRDYTADRFWASAGHFDKENKPLNANDILPVIAVVGPFRSGTSCTAGVLHNLGISMGFKLLGPAPFNVKGCFEALQLRDICRASFSEPDMTEKIPPALRVQKLREWAAGRSRQLGPEKLIGAKHPTLCLMVEDMQAAWPDLKIIAVDRPLEESIASASKTNTFWFPTAAEVLPKMIAARDAAIAKLGIPVLRVSYHSLLNHPGETISDISKFCGISPDDRQLESALTFVDKNLCHHKN